MFPSFGQSPVEQQEGKTLQTTPPEWRKVNSRFPEPARNARIVAPTRGTYMGLLRWRPDWVCKAAGGRNDHRLITVSGIAWLSHSSSLKERSRATWENSSGRSLRCASAAGSQQLQRGLRCRNRVRVIDASPLYVVQNYAAVYQDRREHPGHSARVRLRISSVVIATVALPFSRPTASAPRDGPFTGGIRTSRKLVPSTSNWTSVFGKKPSSSRRSAGMVTCPFDVIRIFLRVRVIDFRRSVKLFRLETHRRLGVALVQRTCRGQIKGLGQRQGVQPDSELPEHRDAPLLDAKPDKTGKFVQWQVR